MAATVLAVPSADAQPAGAGALHGADLLSDEGQAAIVRPGGVGIQTLARVGRKEWRELAVLPPDRGRST